VRLHRNEQVTTGMLEYLELVYVSDCIASANDMKEET
jgi:hypothetical protein